ncbi:MAG: 5-formyltetrahydrofolate cyclo-ligase [Candidatus Gastranaerophilales bacterium]|nr:5-formyltetrahydrofolate cyclo-ligase [Candidatus Gastranaerophilales bacterium]
MFTKNELREKAKQIRSLLEIEKISENIIRNVKETEIYQAAKHIMIFYPMEDEINLLGLLDDDKNFYLPRVEGKELVVCPYKKGDELKFSSFKTQEPTSQPVNPNILEIIFVPALMADKNFHRLGYGKGFYDRFLSKNAQKAIRIVPIASLLVRDSIPSDEFDAQFDIILDEL